MAKKKLQLEILDPVGNVVRTHHFFYEQGQNNKIRITVDGKSFMWEDQEPEKDWKDVVLDKSGSLPKGVDDKWATEFKEKNEDFTKKLFCEETLIPVWQVKYDDPTVGNKGECVYMTVSAKDEQEAKTLALACTDFNKHIIPNFYHAKYLTAFRATGNYKIGEVQYFEGDPRL